MALSAIDLNLTIRPFALSDTAILDPSLKAIDIMADGDVKVQDIEGNDQVYTIPDVAGGGRFPYRLYLRIQKVYTTDTTIGVTDLIGLH